MGTAVKRAFGLDAVADNLTAAVVAGRRQNLNRTFETVKRMDLTVIANFQAVVVFVPASLAFSHI
jgi:hypothetical protein